MCWRRRTAWLLLLPLAAVALVQDTLSPIEAALLQTRLENIETAIQRRYQPQLQGFDTFIFPGAGGIDPLVEELCSGTPRSTIIDWSEHRGSILTAAYDSEAVGQAVASILLENCNEKSSPSLSLHFIGISVGAFAANAAATLLYKARREKEEGSKMQINLTLLDPFCGRGVFGSSYGKDNFGKYASQAIQILNTDDPVPTTNDPLPYCYCLDVTKAKERDDFVPLPGDSMHSWPVAYMARHYQVKEETSLKPGTVVKVLN